MCFFSGLLGLILVLLFLYAGYRSAQNEQVALQRKLDSYQITYNQAKNKLKELKQRADQLETVNQEMAASVLNHLRIGPLATEETTSAVTSTFNGSSTPTDQSDVPFDNLSGQIDSVGSYLSGIYKNMLDRDEYIRAVPSLTPAAGWVTSHFGVRKSPFTKEVSIHNGIDIAATKGTPVYAPADGVIGFAGLFGGYGKYLSVNHGFGIVTRYGHLHRYFVYPGQFVRQGQKIASVGSTGRSTGYHLHYEVRVSNRPVDPRPYMVDAGEKILGDLWSSDDEMPESVLPDFSAPMGGDPDTTETIAEPDFVSDMTIQGAQDSVSNDDLKQTALFTSLSEASQSYTQAKHVVAKDESLHLPSLSSIATDIGVWIIAMLALVALVWAAVQMMKSMPKDA